MDGDATAKIEELSDIQKARLTTWLVEQRLTGNAWPRVTASQLDYAREARPLPVHERADRLLRYLASRSPHIGEPLDIIPPSNGAEMSILGMSDNDETVYCDYYSALAWSESIREDELAFLTEYLASNGWITAGSTIASPSGRGTYYPSVPASGAYLCRVEIPGYSKIAETTANVDSSQCFVAMWFDGSMDEVYDKGIMPAIRDAGYEAYRIDQQQDLIGKIDDAIVAAIRRSRFLVADFTHGIQGARGGVYYEAGFAHGLDIPVIFICRSDRIQDVHFDTRQFNHILWNDGEYEVLCKLLTDRIVASIGEGPAQDN